MRNKNEHYLADYDDLNPDEAFEATLYADRLLDVYKDLNRDYINGKLTHGEYDYYADKLNEEFNAVPSERYHLQFKDELYPTGRIDTGNYGRPNPEDQAEDPTYQCWK